MRTWIKIVASMLLVVFAASSVIQVTHASNMDVAVSVFENADEHDHCEDCTSGLDHAMLDCPTGCAASILALMSPNRFLSLFSFRRFAVPTTVQSMVGSLTAPEPFPPKF